MDPAKEKKLQQQITKAKEKEKEALEKVLKLEQEGYEIGQKVLDDAQEMLDNLSEQREKQEQILKTIKKIDGFEKSHAKALSTATTATRSLLDARAETRAHEELQKNESLEYNATLESIVAKRQKLIGLAGEDAMLAFDLEDTMEELNLLKEDQLGLEPHQIEFIKKQIDYTEMIAQGLDEQAGIHNVMYESQEGLLGALGTSKDALKGMAKGARQFLAAMMANPATAIAAALLAIVTAIISAVKYAGELRDELGVSLAQAGGLMARLGPAALALKGMGLDAKEVGGALLTSFGTLDSLTNKTIVQA